MSENEKVAFMCAGAQKSGTTTLFGLLVQHPDVCLPEQKELYFFCDDRLFRKGYGWYEAQFDCNGLKGDITPDYMLFDKCVDRIHGYNKDMKLIFILRNPAERAFSHYQMKRKDTEERKQFPEALLAEAGRTVKGYRNQMKYSYLERGYYYRLLLPYYVAFGEASIKILIFEEFMGDIEAGMMEVENFLGISNFGAYVPPERTNEGYLPKRRAIAYIKRHFVRPVRGIYNRVVPRRMRRLISSATDTGYLQKETLSDEMRRQLIAGYMEDIEKLEGLLKRDLSIWYK